MERLTSGQGTAREPGPQKAYKSFVELGALDLPKRRQGQAVGSHRAGAEGALASWERAGTTGRDRDLDLREEPLDRIPEYPEASCQGAVAHVATSCTESRSIPELRQILERVESPEFQHTPRKAGLCRSLQSV